MRRFFASLDENTERAPRAARQRHAHRRASIGVDELRSISPQEFEEFFADLMHRSGYRNVQRIGGAKDLTVDIEAIASDGMPIIVQCKRYARDHKVGTPEMQQFIGMAYTHHGVLPGHAMYVTTSYFTRDAVALGQDHNIILIDADVLETIISEHDPVTV